MGRGREGRVSPLSPVGGAVIGKCSVNSDKFLVKVDLSKPLPPPIAIRVQQFRTRVQAENGASQIGWSRIDIWEADVMGFRVWIIVDPHLNAVTRDGFAAWCRDTYGTAR